MTIPKVSTFLNRFQLEIGSMCISVFNFVIAFCEFFLCILLSIDSCEDRLDSKCIVNYIGIATGIGISTVEMIVDLILFVGALRGNPATLILWLVTYALSMIVTIIILIIIATYVEWSETLLLCYIGFIFTITCLFIYMWIVVYSHYCVLKEENARGQYDKQAYRAS